MKLKIKMLVVTNWPYPAWSQDMRFVNGRTSILDLDYVQMNAIKSSLDAQVSSLNINYSVSDFDVFDFGAVNDGTTDNTTAFQTAITFVHGLGGGQIKVPNGSFKISSALTQYADTEFYGQGTTTGTGAISVSKQGKTLAPVGASDSFVGQATLAAGTVTVSTTAVTSSSLIQLTHAGTNITNAGLLSVGTITAGTSFVIHSANSSDTDKVNWSITN